MDPLISRCRNEKMAATVYLIHTKYLWQKLENFYSKTPKKGEGGFWVKTLYQPVLQYVLALIF